MIEFQNVSKSFNIRGHRKVVIDHLNETLPFGKSLALLGRNGAGKSTLLEMIAGTIRPTTGRIVRYGRVSWPVGGSGAIHRDLTGAQNVRFVSRIYGVDSAELEDFVREFSELGKHFNMPMRTYSSGMKSRLSFGISMGIPFDTYLIDEVTAVGDKSFKDKARAYFNERLKNASAIMVSHDLRTLRHYCNAAVVLEKGRLSYFEDLDEAIALHEEHMGGPRARRRAARRATAAQDRDEPDEPAPRPRRKAANSRQTVDE
ncbi:ABC transporter ATP-binding protein [Palleronia sediminis]|uniref:ABC transporter ATP-binding protein n=1 Tax=Palleronia sediminis TaxID=2547833 RepID=A0A4R6A607_9RHOB|nr:ABC transporter ATP-binding protein [Palleronia sediminis]